MLGATVRRAVRRWLAGVGGADGLLDLHEAFVDQADVGVGGNELGHRLTDAGGNFQVLGAEHVDAFVTAHDGRMLQRPGEIEVVRRPTLHADADAWTVDLGNGRVGGFPSYGEDAFDDDVRRGECDLVGTRRVDREEADVGLAGRHRLERLPRGVEADQLQRHLEPPRDLPRDVDGDTCRLLRRALCQHRVAQVDRRPQHTRRCQVLANHARDPTVGRQAHDPSTDESGQSLGVSRVSAYLRNAATRRLRSPARVASTT